MTPCKTCDLYCVCGDNFIHFGTLKKSRGNEPVVMRSCMRNTSTPLWTLFEPKIKPSCPEIHVTFVGNVVQNSISPSAYAAQFLAASAGPSPLFCGTGYCPSAAHAVDACCQ